MQRSRVSYSNPRARSLWEICLELRPAGPAALPFPVSQGLTHRLHPQLPLVHKAHCAQPQFTLTPLPHGDGPPTGLWQSCPPPPPSFPPRSCVPQTHRPLHSQYLSQLPQPLPSTSGLYTSPSRDPACFILDGQK